MDNEELSKRLHKILDGIGASEYIRKKYWEIAMLIEITKTFESIYSNPYNNISYYQVGSRCEGTTTPDFQSDRDMINCDNRIHVVENLLKSKEQGVSYLMLTDVDTKPGYVRLQIVYNKRPQLVGMFNRSEDDSFVDKKGRVCVINSTFFDGPKTSRNGPADTIPGENGICDTDMVYALRCRQIPRSANSWLHRTRKYEWPSHKQLKEMGSYGCFLVGVGHPQSENKKFEWRISFSLQERDLMSSLNETQHKCYILLKMIKKDIIEPNVGESISSYHCKTSLLYTVENSERHIWTEDKLIMCTQMCLVRLFIWVKAKNCPNYLIPTENMFDKLSFMTLKKIEYVLNAILESGIMFLYSLTCDNVGEVLKSKLCVEELICTLNSNNSATMEQRFLICYNSAEVIYQLRNTFMRSMSFNTNTCYMNGVMQLLLYLQHTNHVAEHNRRDVRMALNSVLPHIQLQYKQCMYARCLSQGNLPELQSMQVTRILSKTSLDGDLISSRLSLASLYVKFDKYQEECERILVLCEKDIELCVVSVCGCTDRISYVNLDLAEKLRFTEMSSKYFRRHCTLGCMVFHPSQVSLVHGALHYEMFRNEYTESDDNDWSNWITVDSHMYLYFLQYVLHSKNKKEAEKETAVYKLTHYLNTDLNLGHIETALNLYGWIRLQENDVSVAWRLFCLSWKARPFKNAAKWHMLILLSGVLNRAFMVETEHLN